MPNAEEATLKSPRVFANVAELRAASGQPVGVSEWFEMTQERINAFADATFDHQFIHVDPERAKATPLGATIAHGYFTLSLAPLLASRQIKLEGVRMGLNYGLNKVRFMNPVKVGKRIRAHLKIAEVTDVPGGIQLACEVTFEIEGESKPACVAETLTRYYLN